MGDGSSARHRATVRGGDAALARVPAPHLRPTARASRVGGTASCITVKLCEANQCLLRQWFRNSIRGLSRASVSKTQLAMMIANLQTETAL